MTKTERRLRTYGGCQKIMEGEDVRLMLWDTAGQEEFDAITKAYYRGAQACVLAFSTTNRDSFEAIHSWKMKVEDECGAIPAVIVQNKIDLIDQSVVDPEEAEMLSRALGCRLIRTSVKEDININSVFRYLAAKCLADIHEQEKEYNNIGNGIHPFTISAFGSPTMNGKSCTNGNGTIVLKPGKKGHRKKKNVLRSACRIL
ncbi:hypothetical protein RUM43_014607 [Polyplax serrata]|uniref:Ras-related protein Rab-23 n=1 Tax=Polyplax serrata TaxID=468196 RepID=A0AAN8PGU4_POLSC